MITIHFTWIGPWPNNTGKLEGISNLSRINNEDFRIVWWVENQNIPHAKSFLSSERQQHAVTLHAIEDHPLYQTPDAAWALSCLNRYRAYSLCKDLWSFLVLTYYPGCNFHLDAGIEVNEDLTVPSILTEAANTESKVSLATLPAFLPPRFRSLSSVLISLRPYSVPFYAQMLMSHCVLPANPMRSQLLDVFAMKSHNAVEAASNPLTSYETQVNTNQSFVCSTPNPKFFKVLHATLQSLKKDFGKIPLWHTLLPHSCGRYLITQRSTRDAYIGEICLGQLVFFEKQTDNLVFYMDSSETTAQVSIPSLGIVKKFYHSWRNLSKCDAFDILQFEMQHAKSLSRIILWNYIALQLCPQQRMRLFVQRKINSMFISTLLACPIYPIMQAIEHKTHANERILNAVTAQVPILKPNIRCMMNKQQWHQQPIHLISSTIVSVLSTGLIMLLKSKNVPRIASPSRQQVGIALASLFASTLLEKCVLKASRLHHYSVFKKPSSASDHALQHRTA